MLSSDTCVSWATVSVNTEGQSWFQATCLRRAHLGAVALAQVSVIGPGCIAPAYILSPSSDFECAYLEERQKNKPKYANGIWDRFYSDVDRNHDVQKWLFICFFRSYGTRGLTGLSSADYGKRYRYSTRCNRTILPLYIKRGDDIRDAYSLSSPQLTRFTTKWDSQN